MKRPDQLAFENDLRSAAFRIGEAKGQWGFPGPGILLNDVPWPKVVLWIAAPGRRQAPDRFYVCLDLAGYRAAAPTGSFWDPATNTWLSVERRPKGREGTRFHKVFCSGWNQGTVFYHPYDREAAAHGGERWKQEQPHLVWTSENTIADYLAEFHALMNRDDYVGI